MHGPTWRLGEGRLQIALSGYWTVQLTPAETVELSALALGPADDPAVSSRAVLVTAGSLRVVEAERQRQARCLLTLEVGALISPIRWRATGGVGFEPDGFTGLYLQDDWMHRAAQSPALAPALLAAAAAAVDEQYWLRTLAAHEQPLARLCALLLRIANDMGKPGEHGTLLRGAPDPREMGVLAGVSRENAAIDLEWLVSAGILLRHGGQLYVRDISTLQRLAQQDS